MEFAAWGLVVATLILAILSGLQYLKSRDAVAGQEAATKVLREQAAALAATAQANQAVANEMLAARQREIPLELGIVDYEPAIGTLSVRVQRGGSLGVWILGAEIRVGFADKDVEVWSTTYGSNYLGGGTDGFVISQSILGQQGDSIRLLITGRPQGGIEQIHETLFRIPPGKPPVQLSSSWGPWSMVG